MTCIRGLRVLLHSLWSGRPGKVTSIMDGTGDSLAQRFGSLMSVKGEAGPAFAAFVFRHAGCEGEPIESRVGDDLLACWCLRCDETRTFGTAASKT
jgi:hypothetical protein